MASLSVIIVAIYIILLGPVIGYLLTFSRQRLVTVKIKQLKYKKSTKDDERYVLDTIRNKLVEVKLKELIAQRVTTEMQQVNTQFERLLEAHWSPSAEPRTH